jgi:hypothetical protein
MRKVFTDPRARLPFRLSYVERDTTPLMPINLPASNTVDIGILSCMFSDVNKSYKFLFFLSILDAIEDSSFSQSARFSVRDLSFRMLTLAWYPHVYFKLSFGDKDAITTILERVTVSSMDSSLKFQPSDTTAVRTSIERIETNPERLLARYVIYRLIRPFFPDLGSIPDTKVNGLIREQADLYYRTINPLYRFDGTNDEFLLVHPLWLEYFEKNWSIVRGWANWHYVKFMQKKNPLVPSLTEKLFPPAERESMVAQTQFWKHVIPLTSLKCIYSGQPIDPNSFALDHFLPWSFVVHNELWNLIPTSSAVNSAKSDRLPAESYIEPFVNAQWNALVAAKQSMVPAQWSKYEKQYLSHLELDDASLLLQPSELSCAYISKLTPHVKLAKINGFSDGWLFTK